MVIVSTGSQFTMQRSDSFMTGKSMKSINETDQLIDNTETTSEIGQKFMSQMHQRRSMECEASGRIVRAGSAAQSRKRRQALSTDIGK